VLAADMSLNANDFHSGERTFQLLTQAAGRAGRGDVPGNVVIQTYQPEHYSITTAQAQDYEGFYEQEILYRQIMNYPPAAHMLVIFATSPSEAEATKQAEQMAELLQSRHERIRLLGPVDAAIARINDIYRKVIYIKDKDYDTLIQYKDEVDAYLQQTGGLGKASVWFDFDPMSGF
jgi:primosomal protein N' (replication factor Y)